MTEQSVDISRHFAAGKIIASATKWSAAAGIIPVPFLDLVALATVQGKMIADLSALYGERPSNEAARGLVSVLLGTLAPSGVAGVLLSSGIKAIPGFGTLVTAASMAAFSSAATYAVGKVFVVHFEQGGTFANFSAESVADDLKAAITNAPIKAPAKA